MKKAFTAVEVIVVIIIMGVIASIMMLAIKPNKYRDEALLIQAEKMLAEIDDVTQKIMLFDSKSRDLTQIIDPDTDNAYDMRSAPTRAEYFTTLDKLFRKYLITTKKTCINPNDCSQACATFGNPKYKSFQLKSGSCVALVNDSNIIAPYAVFPNDNMFTKLNFNAYSDSYFHYYMYIDANGLEGPNQYGKDWFQIPLGRKGIIYNIQGTTCKLDMSDC